MSSLDSKDPYKVLGVERDASQDSVKKSYRKLARKLHPDRGGDPEKLKRVNAAYHMVGDTKKRKLYDEFGTEAFRPGFNPEAARSFRNFGGGIGGGFGGSAGASFDFEDIMNMFVGGQGRRRRTSHGPRRGQDVRANLEVSLDEALSGGERRLTIGETSSVTVRIPKGVRPGQSLRLSKKGLPGVDGGPAGDLYLEITIAEHPLVRVDRDDLEMDLPLTFAESIRGGTITASTPTGTVNVKIPRCADAGTRLRLRGRGMPKGGTGTRTGDLYLILRPTPPPAEAADLEEVVESLEGAYDDDVRKGLDFES
jgi:curved DNA-binding protein